MLKSLLEDIASIVERDPAARNGWEVLTCYPGLHATMLHRPAHWCWNHGMKWGGRFLSHLGRMLTGIEIHPGARIGRRVFIDHGFGVVIGETAEVGDDCTIYQGVTLGGTTLNRGVKRHPTLERGVVVGAGAQILGAFTVGEYAKVGGNAVVIRAVPARATAVGNPAKVTGQSSGDEVSTAPDLQAQLALHRTQMHLLGVQLSALEALQGRASPPAVTAATPCASAPVLMNQTRGAVSLADSMHDMLHGDAIWFRPNPRSANDGDSALEWLGWQFDEAVQQGRHAAVH